MSWKDVVKEAVLGNDEARKQLRLFLVQYRGSPVLPKLYQTIMEEYYAQLSLAGAFRREEPISGQRFESVFRAIATYPFADNEVDKIRAVARDLHIENIDELAKFYKEYSEVRGRLEVLKGLGLGWIGAGVVIDKAMRMPAFGRVVVGLGTIASAFEFFRRQVATEATIRDYLDMKNLVQAGITLAGFIYGMRARIPKRVDISTAYEEFLNSERMGSEVSHISTMKNLPARLADVVMRAQTRERIYQELARRGASQVEIETRRVLDMMKLNAEFLDELGAYDIISHRLAQKDEMNFVFSLIKSMSFDELKQFIQGGENIPSHIREARRIVSDLLTRRSLTKIFSKADEVRVKIIDDEGNAVKEMVFPASEEGYIQAFNEVRGRNVIVQAVRRREVGGRVHEEITEYPFTKEYIPAFSKSFVVFGRGKDGGRVVRIASEVDLPDVIEEMVSQGVEVKNIWGSLQAFSTAKFSRQFVERILPRIEAKSPEEMEKIVLEEFRALLPELKKEVSFLPRETQKGFFHLADKVAERKKLSERELEDLYRNLLAVNIARKISDPRGVLKLREVISPLNTESAIRLKRIIDEIEEGRGGFLEKLESFQGFWRRLWLALNTPVRIANTFSLHFILASRYWTSPTNPVKDFQDFSQFMLEVLRAFGRGASSFKSRAFALKSETDLLELANLVVRTPFEEGVREIGQVLSKRSPNGMTWGERLFGIRGNVNYHDILRVFLFSEGVMSKPVWMYSFRGRDLRGIEELSAFFTANYVPFYLALRSWVEAFWNLFGVQDRRILSRVVPISTLTLLSSIYAGMIGLKNTAPFTYVYDLTRLSDLIRNIVLSEDVEPEGTWISITKPVFSLASALFHISDEIPIHVVLGGGLIGGITGMRTRAGALSLPSFLDAPALQLVQDFFTIKNNIDLRLRRGEVSEVQKDIFAIVQTINKSSGIFRKMEEEILGKFTSAMYQGPSQSFVKSLVRVLFPEEGTPLEPFLIQFRDKWTIKEFREKGVSGIATLMGELRKAEGRGRDVLNISLKNLDFLITRHMEKFQKKEFDDVDVDNAIYLVILRQRLKGKDVEFEELQRFFRRFGVDISSSEKLALYTKIREDLRIADALTRRRLREILGRLEL